MGQIFKGVLTSPPCLYCINTCNCFCIQSFLQMSIYHYFAMQVMLVCVFLCLVSIDKHTQAQVGVMLLCDILQCWVLSGQDTNTIFILKIYDGLVLYTEEKKEKIVNSTFSFCHSLCALSYVTGGHEGSMTMCDIPNKWNVSLYFNSICYTTLWCWSLYFMKHKLVIWKETFTFIKPMWLCFLDNKKKLTETEVAYLLLKEKWV